MFDRINTHPAWILWVVAACGGGGVSSAVDPVTPDEILDSHEDGGDDTDEDPPPLDGPCPQLGQRLCVDDFGYVECVAQPNDPSRTTLTPRLACSDGRSCSEGSCVGPVCARPEIALLIDNSSSMVGARWEEVHRTGLEVCRMLEQVGNVHVRLFPDDAACGGAPPSMTCAQLEWAEPALDGATPIASAFDGLGDVFGDPSEAELAFLLTDGDETCDGDALVLRNVRTLRARGVRTIAVAVSQQANPALLEEIAIAGGTAEAPGVVQAHDGTTQFGTVLDSIQGVGGCTCAQEGTPEPICFGSSWFECDAGVTRVVDDAPGGGCACAEGEGSCTGGAFVCPDDQIAWVDGARCLEDSEPGGTQPVGAAPYAVVGTLTDGDVDTFSLAGVSGAVALEVSTDGRIELREGPFEGVFLGYVEQETEIVFASAPTLKVIHEGSGTARYTIRRL